MYIRRLFAQSNASVIFCLLAGHGHQARYVNQFSWDKNIDFSSLQGLLKVTSTEKIAATVLQTRPGQFATLPVAALK